MTIGSITPQDYFDQLYEWAIQLVKSGKAYVCDLTAEQVRHTRGTLSEPGEDSPYRNRSVEENLDLLERMRAGEFPDGSKTLRAKINMASPNLNMRDPVMYRILRAEHHAPAAMVHLPDVRLRARPIWIPSNASRIPSARWSLKTTALSTTGSWNSWVFIIHSRLSLIA